MKERLKAFFTFLFISYSAIICGQASIYEQYEREGLTLSDYNEVLGELGKTIISFTDETTRLENNEVFRTFLQRAINEENSYDYKFDSISTISILKSDDDKLKIYNWAFPYENGTYIFYGFLQIKTEKGIRVVELFDQSDVITSYKYRKFIPEKWFGALYYNILTREHKGKTYYTLIGWDGHNSYTTKKVIDIITIDKYGDVEFGAPIFDLYTNAKPKPKRRPPSPYRMVYEFASMVSMKLNWDTEENYIIFDHLSPLTSDKEEFANYYGPDLTFDSFRWENGNWVLYENVKTANRNKFVPRRKKTDKDNPKR